jgi:uncharacterized protein YecT (DUF1311 family)
LIIRDVLTRLVAAGLLVVPWQALAAEGSSIHCGDLATGVEQKQCAETRYRKASEELREVYGRVLRHAADADTQSLPGAPDEKSRVVAISASQRNWEAYRDAECRGVVGRGDGSGRMVWVLGCLAEKASERARELNVPFDQR